MAIKRGTYALTPVEPFTKAITYDGAVVEVSHLLLPTSYATPAKPVRKARKRSKASNAKMVATRRSNRLRKALRQQTTPELARELHEDPSAESAQA